MALVSCVDTIILPDDRTVDEDFWKSKSDVQLMVNGAYRAMLSGDVISRLIVWGDLRSEELIPVASVTGALVEDLTEINLANTQVDNTFAKWDAVYAVINACNLVLDRAESVMSEDPSYTQGDYQSDCSQMLALRALCYFYLVRNFRDVPFVDKAFMNSSQDRNIPQAAPDSVLTCCINDLKTAEQNALSSSAYTDWRRVGYMTRDAIQSLLADIYLWRGSVLHNASDYEACVEYCDKVIASKKAQHVFGRGENEEKDYYLAEGREMFRDLFVTQNAEESIFELQYEGSDIGNSGVCQYYNIYEDKRVVPYLYATSIMGYGTAEVYTTTKSISDWRGRMNTYSTSAATTVGDFDGFRVAKYVDDHDQMYSSIASVTSQNRSWDRAFSSNYKQNYIIYRLTDVMLMKAEALTALATSDDDVDHLRPAFNLVQVVSTRSKELASDSIVWETYKNSISDMENLVLAERLRELAFEGKRWYDLLRFNYRHVDGIDYTRIMADQENFVATHTGMLELMKRKLGGKGNAVAAKLDTEPKLYMPIPLSDLNICPALKQNPGYDTNSRFSKNY